MGRPWLLYLRGLALDRGHRRGKELNLGRGDRQIFKKRVSSFVQVSYQYGLRKRLSSASKAASTLDLELIRTILCGVDSLVSLTVVRDYVSTCEMPDITDVIKILAGRLGQKSPNSWFFFLLHILSSRADLDVPQNGDFGPLWPVFEGALSEVGLVRVYLLYLYFKGAGVRGSSSYLQAGKGQPWADFGYFRSRSKLSALPGVSNLFQLFYRI